MNEEERIKYSEVFDLAVKAIIRYGRESMTMPGFSAALSRKAFEKVVRRSRTKDKISYIEKKIVDFTYQTDRYVCRKT